MQLAGQKLFQTISPRNSGIQIMMFKMNTTNIVLKMKKDFTSKTKVYRGCRLAVMAGIPVKFGTAHGTSVWEVGGAKCIGAYGRKWVPPAPHIFGTSKQKIITPTDLLRPIHNFYSLTICS